MSYYIAHSGNFLYLITDNGVLTVLTGGLTAVRPARYAILSNTIVVVNATSVNRAINTQTGEVRPLNIEGPTTGLVAADGGAGNLIGTFRYAYSFAIIGANEEILTESPLSVISDPLTLSSRDVDLSSIDASGDSSVNARIVYRTTNGGVAFFELTRILDNTTTTYTDNLSDYDLGLLPVQEGLGNPPGVDGSDRFRLIATWKNRLFASPANNPDYVYVSGNGQVYAWPEENRLTISVKGEDQHGVTAFMPRRDELVIAKRSRLWKVRGNSPEDFEVILVAEGIGSISPDASIVVSDVCYFLDDDGFYEYGPRGVNSLTRDKVHGWFTTDTYFNRSMFPQAFAKYNEKYDSIDLHLAAAGSTEINRWVSYDLRTRTWLGPHKTDAFTPTCSGTLDDSNGFSMPVVGGDDGYLYRQNYELFTDAGFSIDLDIKTKPHSADTPDILHYWGDMSLLTKKEERGTLMVTPYVGDLAAEAGNPILVNLEKGRHRLRRLGVGRFCQLQFTNDEDDVDTTIYGYELPVHELGRR